jgi:hypothetical protein
MFKANLVLRLLLAAAVSVLAETILVRAHQGGRAAKNAARMAYPNQACRHARR